MREDWSECLLGEISSKITKGSTPTTYGYKYQKVGINFIKIENVIQGRIDKKSIYQFISEEAHESQKRSQLEEGDVLFSIAGTIGETCLITKDILPANTNQAFAIISGFNKVLDANFLRKQLDSFVSRKLKDKARGGAMNNVSLTDLKELNLVIPPLAEQNRIISKIEELFSDLDKGIADLKKAQDQLKVYRQAVLKKAFEGDWEEVELGDVCDKVSKVKRKELPKDSQLLYLDIGGIDNIKNIIIGHKEYTWENAPSRAQQIVSVGDVLFSTVRTYLKNIARVEKSIYENEIASSGFTVIRGKEGVLSSKFIFFITTSQFFLEPLNKLQRGTSYPAVRDKDVFSQKIPLPSLEEQHQIVQEIESRLSVCDKVEESITESLEKAKALRQSILKKAFEGTLLSEKEIAACKAAPDYEPASALLKKIKKEKEKEKV